MKRRDCVEHLMVDNIKMVFKKQDDRILFYTYGTDDGISHLNSMNLWTFPSYVLQFNTLHFRYRISPHPQACFF